MPEKTKHYIFWIILTLVVFAASLLLFVQIGNFKRGEDLYSAESALNLVKNVFQKKSHNVGMKDYNNQTLGFSLSYPDKLTLTESGKEIVLEHRVPFKNTGECDFKGDGITYNFLTDFKATFQVFDGTVRQAVEKNSPYMPKENFSGDLLTISPGFIDEYRAGNLLGFAIYEGVEGCGHTIYYLPVASGKVLVATRNMVQILSGIFSDMRERELLKVPGVINNDENKAIFEQILQSFKLTAANTSEMKTYRNEKYGFELEYPENWNMNEDNQPTFSIITLGGNTLQIGVENKFVNEMDICQQKKAAVSIGTQGTNWCFDGNPDDRWVTFINQESSPTTIGVVFYCWFPVSKNNEAACNQVLSTFKFIK